MPDALFMALWMGFLIAAVAFVGASSSGRRSRATSLSRRPPSPDPLAACFLLLYISRGTVLSWLFGIAGVGYLAWIVLRRHQEEQQIEETWSPRRSRSGARRWRPTQRTAAPTLPGARAGAAGRSDGAADHYRHALELDLNNVRELLMFLARRGTRRSVRSARACPTWSASPARCASAPPSARRRQAPSPADLRAEREGAPPAGDTEETGSPFPRVWGGRRAPVGLLDSAGRPGSFRLRNGRGALRRPGAAGAPGRAAQGGGRQSGRPSPGRPTQRRWPRPATQSGRARSISSCWQPTQTTRMPPRRWRA